MGLQSQNSVGEAGEIKDWRLACATKTIFISIHAPTSTHTYTHIDTHIYILKSFVALKQLHLEEVFLQFLVCMEFGCIDVFNMLLGGILRISILRCKKSHPRKRCTFISLLIINHPDLMTGFTMNLNYLVSLVSLRHLEDTQVIALCLLVHLHRGLSSFCYGELRP
jgi:hypothetical protein